jgi:Tetratricopeptide repeat.
MSISRDIGDVRREQLIAINYGSTYLLFVGPDRTVVERIRQALAWGETSGDAISIGQAWNLLAMDAYYRGDLAEARQYLDQSSAAFTGVAYAYIKAQALRAQATLCKAEGRLDAALALIEQALAVSRQIEAPHLITEMRSIAGEILLGLGRTDEALVATSKGAAGADPNVFQSYLVHYRHFKALAAAGRQAEAQSALARAWQEFNALLDSLTPAQRERSRTAIPAHRELLADAAGQLHGAPLCIDTF